MIKNLAVDAAMLTIFAHMILLGALEYSISQTSDDGLKRTMAYFKKKLGK